MLDLILAGPGVTPDLVCDLADEFMAGESSRAPMPHASAASPR